MSERDDLLRGIREHPEDDAPRLVFADWLDEVPGAGRGREAKQAREWAALIRQQIEAVRCPRTDPRYWELRAWAQFNRKSAAAVALVPQPIRKWVSYSRGFPDSLRLTPASFLKHAATIDELIAPLNSLCLTSVGSRLVDVLARPELARFRSLTVSRRGVSHRESRAIADCPHLAGLSSLSLDGLIPPGVSALLESPHLAGLQSIWFDGHFSAGALRSLLTSTTPRPLKQVVLHGEIEPGDLAALVAAPSLANVASLGLTGGPFDESITQRLAGGALPCLTALSVRGPLTNADFFRSACFRRLTKLNVYQGIASSALPDGEDVGEPGLSLELYGASPGDLSDLVRSPIVGRCVALTVGHPGLSVDDLLALAQSPFARHLRAVVSRNTPGTAAPIDGETLEPLIRSPYLASLIELQFSGRSLTDDGLRALTEATFADSLRFVNLSGCDRLSADALVGLTNPKVWPRLISLNLGGPVLRQEATVAALRERWPDGHFSG